METELLFALIGRLAAGIVALQTESHPVEPRDAVSWAAAAALYGTQAGVDPFELVAIARNETDFRPNRVGPDGKDCGLLQTRVTYSRYRCRELRADPWKAIEEGARGLAAYQAHCATTRPDDLTRCRLNSYNQGYRYKTSGRKGAYWLRIMCFAEAAREGVAPKGNCRKARNRKDIARLVYGPPALASTESLSNVR